MKTIEEHIKDKGLVNSYFTTDDFYILHRVAVEAAKEYATEREQKWKELYEALIELNELLNKLFGISARDINRRSELRQQITALEQELGLNKE